MEMLSALLAFCVETHQPPLESPQKGVVMWSSDVLFVDSLNEATKEMVNEKNDVLIILKFWENNGIQEIVLVTPTPGVL